MGRDEKIKPLEKSSEMERDEKFKLGEKWALIGVYGNVLLTVVKALAGVLAGSSAMVADAIHSASDIFASIVVFFSLKIAKRPPDEGHPYGHGKAEAISTSVVSVLLIGAGIQIIWSSITTIINNTAHTPGVLALYAAVISIVVKEAMFQYTYRVGKKINSPSTMANAWHHRSDAYSSVAALIGIGGARLGYPILDPVAGAVVALFIIKVGIEIMKDAIRQIMDTVSEQDIIDRIKEVVMKVDGIVNVKRIRARQSGPYIIVDLNIYVDPNLNIKDAHEISLQAKKAVFKNISDTFDVMIHIDPGVYENGELVN